MHGKETRPAAVRCRIQAGSSTAVRFVHLSYRVHCTVQPSIGSLMLTTAQRYSLVFQLLVVSCAGCRTTTPVIADTVPPAPPAGGYVCDHQVATKLPAQALFARAQRIAPSFGLRAAKFDSAESRVSLDADDGPLLPDWPGRLGVRYRFRLRFVAADSGEAGSRMVVSPGVSTWPTNISNTDLNTIAYMAGAFVTRFVRAVAPEAQLDRLCNAEEFQYLKVVDDAKNGQPAR